MELTIENKLGVTKGTVLEEAVRKNFNGESWEVGWYLAAARQAQREGLPEIAEVLKAIAFEEAAHAARFAELNGEVGQTRANLEQALRGEIMANKGKREAALLAREAGVDPAHDVFDESAKDEGRHARALEGLLQRYFK